MIKTLIIDDEAFAREFLRQQLEEYCSGMIEVVGLAGSAIEGLKLINQEQPELVFLDVEMPMGNGFDLLALAGIRHFEVIFTTAYQEYALRALKHKAMDYLLKPIDTDELILAVKNAISHIDAKHPPGFTQSQKLKLQSLKETVLVQMSDVLYLEADGRYTRIHLASGVTHMVSRNIGEFEEELIPYRFFRIHKSVLVNLDKVISLHQDHENMELQGGVTLPVSKRRQSSVAALLRSKPPA